MRALFYTWLFVGLCGCPSGQPEGTGPGPEADAGAPPLECAEEHAMDWPVAPPSQCNGLRTCLDERGRWWLSTAPFIPRGLYNAGYEYARVLDNCPSGAACESTTPADVQAYVEQLASAGFNLIQERSRQVEPLRQAVNADPRVYFAHLLWSDPFTEEGHDALVADIEAAAEDPDVIMWMGPDEIDMWNNWDEALAIRRLLRGSSEELDGLLSGIWAPEAGSYLPAEEPAHDPYGLPFGAAIDSTGALRNASRLYELLMPTVYPLQNRSSDLDGSRWGLPRVMEAEQLGASALPVLQMVGIDSMGLAQPSPQQIRALIAGSLVAGAQGAFYYTYISEGPGTAGREAWYAPDDVHAFAAYAEMHQLQDRLIPVLFSRAEVSSGVQGGLHWRRWTLDGRAVVLVVNSRAEPDSINVESLLPGARRRRLYENCQELVSRDLELPAYGVLALEGWSP